MAGYLTTNNINVLTGAFSKHFDTFSAYHNITIYKEPKRILVSYSGIPYAGFGEYSNQDNYTYETQTGVFPTIIRDGLKMSSEGLEDTNLKLGKEQVVIKVKEDAKAYLEAGKTEKIELNDGRTYNSFALYSVQNYLGLKFFTYILDRTT